VRQNEEYSVKRIQELSAKRSVAVASEIVVCTKCPLWKTRKNAVSGEGNPKTKIMLIGEAPGRSEDLEGKPFVGMAGKFLESLLADIGLSRAGVFICNVLKCRPPRNRPPRPSEIQACTPYLERQIRIIKPAFIVTLGGHSTAYIFSKANLPFTGITGARGKLHETMILNRKVAVFPTFHPAAALYNPRYKEQIVKDFKMLKHVLKKREKVSRSLPDVP
jgi:DNA polymerase